MFENLFHAEPAKNLTFKYTYDNLHRLSTEETIGLPDAPMTYDEREFVYNDTPPVHAPKQVVLNKSTPLGYAYDDNGNLKSGPDITGASNPAAASQRDLDFNADNMPLSIDNGAGTTVAFTYDGQGKRARKTAGADSVYYIGPHYQIRNGAAVKYIFAGGERVAKITAAGDIYYYHKDHLGSSSALSNANGDMLQQVRYTAFGGVRSESGSDSMEHKYTDQEFDDKTNLYNYNARLYDPETGMFISADSIVSRPGDPQSMNRYGYARNNPLLFIDPSGHADCYTRSGNYGSSIYCSNDTVTTPNGDPQITTVSTRDDSGNVEVGLLVNGESYDKGPTAKEIKAAIAEITMQSYARQVKAMTDLSYQAWRPGITGGSGLQGSIPAGPGGVIGDSVLNGINGRGGMVEDTVYKFKSELRDEAEFLFSKFGASPAKVGYKYGMKGTMILGAVYIGGEFYVAIEGTALAVSAYESAMVVAGTETGQIVLIGATDFAMSYSPSGAPQNNHQITGGLWGYWDGLVSTVKHWLF